MTTATLTATLLHETDLQQHIEDTRLIWIARNGRPTHCAWNELTDSERAQVQADERWQHYRNYLMSIGA